MARKRKRKSRRRQEGRKILELVPQYSIESGEDKPVTAARKHIQRNWDYTPSCINCEKKRTHNRSLLFWAEKGLFGAQYVEENHFLFPSLREYHLQVTPSKTPVSAGVRS